MLATALSAYCVTYTTLVIYAAVFGATIGAYVGLTSVVLVDLLGLEKLTNAFGLVIMFQGIASLAGPPIAGTSGFCFFTSFAADAQCHLLTGEKKNIYVTTSRPSQGHDQLVRSRFLRCRIYDRHQRAHAVLHPSQQARLLAPLQRWRHRRHASYRGKRQLIVTCFTVVYYPSTHTHTHTHI